MADEGTTKKTGLGDRMERFIESNMPRTAELVKKDEDCGCGKRKKFMNNIGAIFG